MWDRKSSKAHKKTKQEDNITIHCVISDLACLIKFSLLCVENITKLRRNARNLGRNDNKVDFVSFLNLLARLSVCIAIVF